MVCRQKKQKKKQNSHYRTFAGIITRVRLVLMRVLVKDFFRNTNPNKPCCKNERARSNVRPEKKRSRPASAPLRTCASLPNSASPPPKTHPKSFNHKQKKKRERERETQKKRSIWQHTLDASLRRTKASCAIAL